MSVRIQHTIARQNRFSSLGEHLSEPKIRFYFIYIVDNVAGILLFRQTTPPRPLVIEGFALDMLASVV